MTEEFLATRWYVQIWLVMKRFVLSNLVAVVMVVFCGGLARAQVVIEVRNNLDEPRADQVAVLDLTALEGKVNVQSSSPPTVTDAATGEAVLSQLWDDDEDGVADQLIFLVSLWPKESRRYKVSAEATTANQNGRAYAAYIPERDDVAWESDRIAYRTYGQGLWTNPDYDPLVSSGIDVWVKRTRDLIIDRWYSAGHDAYHLDHGEGADFFSVGPSLGAGGSAVWLDGTMYPAKNFKGHRIIAAGPVRASFELTYDPWDAGGRMVAQTKRITIDAGQNLYREETEFHFEGDEPIPFVVGFVKRKEGIVGSTKRGPSWSWLSTWGPVERKNGGHGDLGSAAVIATDRMTGFVETDDHYLLTTYAGAGERVSYLVGSGWTASGDFDSVEDWWAYLDQTVRRLESPLELSVVE